MSAVTNPQLSLLRGRVRQFIDERVQANFLDSDINYAINEAQQQLAVEISQVDENYFVNPVPTAITIAAGSATYPLANDCWEPIRVINSVTGIRIPFVAYNTANSAPAFASSPLGGYGSAGYGAYLIGNSIGFIPTPTDPSFAPIYWYIPILPDLQSDTDTSIVPRPFLDIMCMDAAIDMLIQDEDDTSALERKRNRAWDRMMRTTRSRQKSDNRRVSRGAGISNQGLL